MEKLPAETVALSNATESLQNAGAYVRPAAGRIPERICCLDPAIKLREPGRFPVRVTGAVYARDDFKASSRRSSSGSARTSFRSYWAQLVIPTL